MKVMEQCPDLFDFEEIKRNLIANNWDVNQVIALHKAKNLVELQLINCSNPSNTHVLQLSKTEFGMAIIQHLVAVQPI